MTGEKFVTESKLEFVLAGLATKDDLRAAVAPLATREELRATKEELLATLATKDEMRAAVASLATKEELARKLDELGSHMRMLHAAFRADIQTLAGQVQALVTEVAALNRQ